MINYSGAIKAQVYNERGESRNAPSNVMVTAKSRLGDLEQTYGNRR